MKVNALQLLRHHLLRAGYELLVYMACIMFQDTDQETGGVSVGVFIAVCIVCAAVFFVIGLMVNKYWGNRRARSFNVEQVRGRIFS